MSKARASDSFESGITPTTARTARSPSSTSRSAGRQRQQSYAALDELRTEIVPATVGKLKGAEVVVGGNAAMSKDYNDMVKGAAPIVFGFVLILAFLLLLVTFRSICPDQGDRAEPALRRRLLRRDDADLPARLAAQAARFRDPRVRASWLPLFLFVILFGLSMDYHVYILSRVREGFHKGMSTEDAVTHGIKQTAGVVTSAAFVMVGVFAIFGTLSIVDYKMLGVGLGFAIFIDATLVRAVLLPATMKLLGDRNWYLPKWLGWLPRFDHEGSVDEPRARPGGNGAIPEPSAA